MWKTDPSQAVYKFCNGITPFDTATASRCLTIFGRLQHLHALISGEAGSLIRSSRLPAVDAELSASAKAVLTVMYHSIELSFDAHAFGDLCLARERGNITEARFEEEITHMAANLLAISLNAAYVTAGIAVELSPIDYPHELVALSAQRLHALADEVAHVVGKGVLSSMTVI